MELSLPQIIAAIVNFFVLLVILKVFLYKPVFGMLEARKEEIDQNLSEAERARQEAEELKEKYEVELKEANTKAQAIINEATELGEKNRAGLIAEARAEILRLNERAKADIARETEQAALRFGPTWPILPLMRRKAFSDVRSVKRNIRPFWTALLQRKLRRG